MNGFRKMIGKITSLFDSVGRFIFGAIKTSGLVITTKLEIVPRDKREVNKMGFINYNRYEGRRNDLPVLEKQFPISI